VAVDLRWLVLSLKHHYSELLADVDPAGGHSPGDAQPSAATPWDYLDKIFQITYALRPIGAHAEDYLRALLPEEAVSPTPPPATPPTPSEQPTEGPTTEVLSAIATSRAVPMMETGRFHRDDQAMHDFGPGQLGAQLASIRPGRRVVRNLRPEGLRLRAAERGFIPLLGPLVPTPRAAKKLLNVYRIIRIGIADNDLAGFVGAQGDGPFRAVLVLLGIVVGHPLLAQPVLSAVRSATSTTDFLDLLRDLRDRAGTADPTAELTRLAERVERIDKQAPGGILSDVAVYQEWVATTARFSFHTRDLIDEVHAFDEFDRRK
jgi:hypothetical protein